METIADITLSSAALHESGVDPGCPKTNFNFGKWEMRYPI